MRAAVVGMGAVGVRAARVVSDDPSVDSVTLLDERPGRAARVASALGEVASVHASHQVEQRLLSQLDVLLLCQPGDHASMATLALEQGCHVVSAGGSSEVVRSLLALEEMASSARRAVVAGAGFSPGLSCLLARHFAATFDEVEEMHVARVGWGGVACRAEGRLARLAAAGTRRGSGRRWLRRQADIGLRWFPDPLGPFDTVPAATGEPDLLRDAFPELRRVTARVAVRRSLLSRATARGEEDALGGIWLELRGRRGSACDVVVTGALDRPAVAAGAVAGVTALWATGGLMGRWGAGGIASLVDDTVPFLRRLASRGVRGAVFEAAGRPRTL